jgi:hypothetical protein
MQLSQVLAAQEAQLGHLYRAATLKCGNNDQRDHLGSQIARRAVSLGGERIDVIVIGADEGDAEQLITAILAGDRGTRVLPYDGFRDLVERGVERWRDKKWMAHAVAKSQALLTAKLLVQALRSKITCPASDGVDRQFESDRVGGLSRRSMLAELGIEYSASRPAETRRAALSRAEKVLELDYIAAWLRWCYVSTRGKARANPSFRDAHDAYAADLAWLRERHPGTDILFPS